MSENKEILIQDQRGTFLEGGELYEGSYLPSSNEGERHLPSSFKIGRTFEIKRPNIEKYIFSALEETEDENIAYLKSIGKNISLYTMEQINFALGKLLYNTSYLHGNLEQNTGLSKDGKLSGGLACGSFYEIQGKKYYYGEITIKLNELAAEALGVEKASCTQRQEILRTLKAMCNVCIKDTETTVEIPLVNIRYSYEDPKTKAKVLNLVLHPIYAVNVQKNFGAHPQDILKRLKSVVKKGTYAQVALLSLLGIQDKRKPYKIYVTKLLERLDLMDAYKVRKDRTLKQLNSTIDAMVKCGIITKQPSVIVGNTGELLYTFTLNKDYAKTEEEEEDKDEN